MAVSVVSFSFPRAAQPEAQGLSFLLSAGFLYHIFSATSLDPNSIGGPEPLRSGVALPTTPRLYSNSNCNFLSWLSYILFQRPLNRPLNLWNGMFDCHQAEITVMQFRGHSLPVYQSMSVSWDFLPCPISSANFRLRDFFRLRAIGICHFLPVNYFGMAYFPGSKVKIQHLY